MKTLCFVLICLGVICIVTIGIFLIAWHDFMHPGPGDDE